MPRQPAKAAPLPRLPRSTNPIASQRASACRSDQRIGTRPPRQQSHRPLPACVAQKPAAKTVSRTAVPTAKAPAFVLGLSFRSQKALRVMAAALATGSH